MKHHMEDVDGATHVPTEPYLRVSRMKQVLTGATALDFHPYRTLSSGKSNEAR